MSQQDYELLKINFGEIKMKQTFDKTIFEMSD